MNRIQDRMVAFFDWLKETRGLKNDRALAHTLCISPSSISTIRSGKRGFAIETLATIAHNHPQLNTYWLLTGIGEMLHGKKVLVTTSRGIEEYTPPEYNPLADYKDDDDLYDRLRGAHEPRPLARDAQEVLFLKREVEKWKNKYIECLEKTQKDTQ